MAMDFELEHKEPIGGAVIQAKEHKVFSATEPNTDKKPKSNVFLNHVLFVSFRKLFHNKLLKLGLIACVFLASIVWTNWIFSNLQTSVQFQQELMQKQYDLRRDIQRSTNSIIAYNDADIDQKRQQAEAFLFTGYIEIAQWLYRLSEESKQNDMTIEYQMFDAVEDEQLKGIFIIPIEITVLALSKDSVNKTYDDFLRFLHIVVSDKKYKRFLSASIVNSSEASAQMAIKIEVRKRQDDFVPASNGPSTLLSDDMAIVE
jgi:hypothetical protein